MTVSSSSGRGCVFGEHVRADRQLLVDAPHAAREDPLVSAAHDERRGAAALRRALSADKIYRRTTPRPRSSRRAFGPRAHRRAFVSTRRPTRYSPAPTGLASLWRNLREELPGELQARRHVYTNHLSVDALDEAAWASPSVKRSSRSQPRLARRPSLTCSSSAHAPRSQS